MNVQEVISAAKAGGHMRHTAKGGCYEIIGPCKVQIGGIWVPGIYYSNGSEVFVRAADDCGKFELISE